MEDLPANISGCSQVTLVALNVFFATDFLSF